MGWKLRGVRRARLTHSLDWFVSETAAPQQASTGVTSSSARRGTLAPPQSTVPLHPLALPLSPGSRSELFIRYYCPVMIYYVLLYSATTRHLTFSALRPPPSLALPDSAVGRPHRRRTLPRRGLRPLPPRSVRAAAQPTRPVQSSSHPYLEVGLSSKPALRAHSRSEAEAVGFDPPSGRLGARRGGPLRPSHILHRVLPTPASSPRAATLHRSVQWHQNESEHTVLQPSSVVSQCETSGAQYEMDGAQYDTVETPQWSKREWQGIARK